MEDNKISDRLDRVARRVINEPSCALPPILDTPIDRVLNVEVSKVLDLVGNMTLMEVHNVVQLAMSIDKQLNQETPRRRDNPGIGLFDPESE
jgi:hypothetical protein